MAEAAREDSSGVPWAGRELPVQPFAGDDGSPDPVLAAALAAAAGGSGSVADVVHALAAARVIVPVVAVLGTDHPAPTLARGDLGADMAVVTVTGADGRVALPVFSGTETLRRWDPQARPVPVECRRAALAAVDEGCELLLLDPSGPVRFGVPRAAVWAIAQGRDWVPAAEDAELLAALQRAVHPLPDVLGLRLERAGDTGVRIVLGVRAGLDRTALEAVVHAARALIGEVEILPERADAVELRILPA